MVVYFTFVGLDVSKTKSIFLHSKKKIALVLEKPEK